MKRVFLFLQGVCSPFFARLADQLKSSGHQVFKVNFNVGDACYWGGRAAFDYRGKLDELAYFLDQKLQRYQITDIVLFGDKRPIHKAALELAEKRGRRIHVFEEGYYRPIWVTLERNGVNAHSQLPRDPDWYREAALNIGRLPKPVRFRSAFHLRAIHDIAYHCSGILNPILYPGYRTHAPVSAPIEYFGYMKRFSLLRVIRQREHTRVRDLIVSRVPYFVLPLQLNGDAQIRDHSFFNNMEEVINYTLESFARHAPHEARLVIKNHPLDMGFFDYRNIVKLAEEKFGICGRTLYLEDGDLTELVAAAQGLVTVNSTTGFYSIEQGLPTKALSNPIYDLPGLTFQGSIDEFWRTPTKPEERLANDYRKVLLHATQINGGFYSRKGIELAVKNSVPRLVAEHSLLEELSWPQQCVS